AAGGSFAIVLRTPKMDQYNGIVGGTSVTGYGEINAVLGPRTIIVDQTYVPSDLDPALLPGGCFLGCRAAEPTDLSPQAGRAALNQAHVGADMVERAGFDSVALTAEGMILFNGAVSFDAGRSIVLEGALVDSNPVANVTVTAPYIRLGLPFGLSNPSATSA